MAFSDHDPVAEEVIRVVCAVYGISTTALVSKRRYQELNDARHTVALILHRLDYTQHRIARELQRDRTTARHSIYTAPALIETDPLFKERYEVAMELISRRPS